MDIGQTLAQGQDAQRAGDLGQAVRLYKTVLAQDPANAQALCLMASVAQHAGDAATARHLAEQACQIRPDWFLPWIGLGQALQSLGRQDQAVLALRRAVGLNPKSTQAWINLSSVLNDLNQTQDAQAAALTAILQDPAQPAAHINMGLALLAQDSPGEAAECFEKALAHDPENLPALCNLGIALTKAGDPQAALPPLAQALALAPGLAQLHYARGNALNALGRRAEAADCYAKSVQFCPDDPDMINDLAVCLEHLGHLDQADRVLSDGLARLPGHAELRLTRAYLNLRQGQWRQGWADHECRWDTAHFARHRRALPIPTWDGGDPAGKSILVTAEQGFGDQIQFCRLCLVLAQRGARVTLECRKSLAPLFAQSLPDIAILAAGSVADWTGFDVCIPLLSLPHRLGLTPDRIPFALGYLKAPDLHHDLIRRQPGLKVGLAWAGSKTRADNAGRSLDPQDLARLAAMGGITLFSLQKDQGPPPAPMIDLAPLMTDFAQTAALVTQLDLVVTIDTALAHLTGALGRPGLVLLANPCTGHLWMDHPTRTPWYDSLRLIRQDQPGTWSGALSRLADHLAERKG